VSTVFLETTGDRHLRRIGGLALGAACAGGELRARRASPPAPPLARAADAGARRVRARPRRRVRRAGGCGRDIELVDDDARRKAEWNLIRGMNKSYEGPVDALINWRFSMRITRALSHRSLAVTPNHVTIAAILVGLTASALVLRGDWLGFALGGVLLEINSILDSVDGELARLRFQYSKVGQWLDNLSDDLVDNAFIAATGYALGGVWMWIGFAAAGGRLAHALSTYVWVYATTGGGDLFSFRWWFESATASAAEVYSPASVTTWLRSFGRRDTFVFVWMIAALCGLPQWIVVHGAVIAAVNVSLLVLHFTVFRNRRA
jgi:phosphatidylglycerophosphate synthase